MDPVETGLKGLSRSYLFEDLTTQELWPLAETATTRTIVRRNYFREGFLHAKWAYDPTNFFSRNQNIEPAR